MTTNAVNYLLDPAGWEAISSQFRVWPLLPATIVTFGERNRNPGHRFAGLLLQLISGFAK